MQHQRRQYVLGRVVEECMAVYEARRMYDPGEYCAVSLSELCRAMFPGVPTPHPWVLEGAEELRRALAQVTGAAVVVNAQEVWLYYNLVEEHEAGVAD
jgi:hypothetical protein